MKPRHYSVVGSELLNIYLQVAVTVAVEPAQPVGTVYERLGSLSHETVLEPLVSSMNLYSNEVPTGIVTTTYHRWLDDVYWSAERATALEVSQLPS